MENEFDRNLQHKLLKHSSNMDVDAFWDRLEPKLPRDPSRPRFIVFFIFLGGGLCATLFAWHLFLNQKFQQTLLSTLNTITLDKNILIQDSQHVLYQGKNVLNVNKVIQEGNSNLDLNQNNLEKLNSSSNDLSSNLKTTDVNESQEIDVIQKHNAENKSEEKKIHELDDKKNRSNSKKSNLSVSKSNASLLKSDKNQSVVVRFKNSSFNENHSNTKNFNLVPQQATGFNPSQVQNKSVKLGNSNSKIKNEVRTENELENYVSATSTNKLISNSPNTTDKRLTQSQQNAGTEIKLNLINTSLELLPILLHLFPIEERKLDLTLNPIITIELEPKAIHPGEDKINVSLMPLIGIGAYSKKLQRLNTNDTLQNYVWLRNQAESKLEEWNFGLNIILSYQRIGLLTGLEYVERNEKFVYYSQEEAYKFGMTSIRREFIQDTSEVIDTLSGIGWYGSNTIRNVVNYNKIRQWNIPIGLNYQTSINKLGINIGFGAMISLSNHIFGKTIDTHLNIANWNQSADLAYRKRLGMGWYGDLGCNYKLNRRMAIATNIRIQSFPTNYLSGPLSLHYFSCMFRTGLMISLNR